MPSSDNDRGYEELEPIFATIGIKFSFAMKAIRGNVAPTAKF
jgi:hypothetical protein